MRIIHLQLQMDSFPRFIRTKKFQELIMKKHKNNSKLLIPKMAIQFPFKEEDFINSKINENDFKFMKHILMDDFEWELIGSQPNEFNIYHSNCNLLPNLSSNHSMSKLECVFKDSLENVLTSIIPTFQMTSYNPWITNFTTSKWDSSIGCFDMVRHSTL
jgi:hypothetical protein